MNMKEVLEGILSEEELQYLRTSFDIIGDVAIIEVPEELEHREKLIAEAILKVHKRIKTVCKKTSERKGTHRLRKVKKILGKKTETIHKEHGAQFKLDVKSVYFSPRESTERERIADMVQEGETVMVMFAGVGPYAIVIAKKKPVKKVYGIEINKKGYEYMKENVKLNKLGKKMVPIHGDVKDKAPKYFRKCDRVLMPLPKGGPSYLELAIRCLKPKGGFIHFYYITPDFLFSEVYSQAKNIAAKRKKKVRVLAKRQVLPYAPHRWKNCIDFELY